MRYISRGKNLEFERRLAIRIDNFAVRFCYQEGYGVVAAGCV
jgi:hypothetical protein